MRRRERCQRPARLERVQIVGRDKETARNGREDPLRATRLCLG